MVSLMARRPYKRAAVALANKMARTIWALLLKGGSYQVPAMAKAQEQNSWRLCVGIKRQGTKRDEPEGQYLDVDQTV